VSHKVIVLILSYNGKHLLADSISSYRANDYPNFEVVVIDNGSTDNSKEWVEKKLPGCFCIKNRNKPRLFRRLQFWVGLRL
jgi:glycosyltransferase involved in cell wall biosynthesis